MTYIFSRHSLTLKYMSHVSPTIGTSNFSTSTICICSLVYGSGDSIIKTWPTTVRIKFISRFIEWSITYFTSVNTFFFHIHILTRIRTFCTLVYKYIFFKCAKFIYFSCPRFKVLCTYSRYTYCQ